MKRALLIIISLFVVNAVADTWHVVSVDKRGTVTGCSTESNTLVHELGENEYPVGYTFPANEFRYWKKVGNDWVGMTPAEQSAYDEAQFNLRKTVYWTNLVTDIDMYQPLMDTYSSNLLLVADSKTKQAFKDVKDLIKKLQDEIKDLKVIIGKLEQYE
jgi:hypothetical protein